MAFLVAGVSGIVAWAAIRGGSRSNVSERDAPPVAADAELGEHLEAQPSPRVVIEAEAVSNQITELRQETEARDRGPRGREEYLAIGPKETWGDLRTLEAERLRDLHSGLAAFEASFRWSLDRLRCSESLPLVESLSYIRDAWVSTANDLGVAGWGSNTHDLHPYLSWYWEGYLKRREWDGGASEVSERED